MGGYADLSSLLTTTGEGVASKIEVQLQKDGRYTGSCCLHCGLLQALPFGTKASQALPKTPETPVSVDGEEGEHVLNLVPLGSPLPPGKSGILPNDPTELLRSLSQ